TGNPGGTSGSTGLQCPGDSSPPLNPGPVYNYRDKSPGDSLSYSQGGGNGPGASPYAYDPTSKPPSGYENCGSSGRMVYWKNAVPSPSYGVDIKINNSRTGTFCVRENVSVRFYT